MNRKICVVTGTRADYGLLYWLMKEIQDDSALELQVVVGGMHLSPEFGMTVDVVRRDGFSIDAKVEMLLSSDTPGGMAKSMGIGMIGFADAFERLQPDIVVLLGDRFEMFAAGQAALLYKIPIAHIHGGEVTEGAVDEAFRHGLSKMSLYHFVAAEEYRRRVIQLGEHPERVFNVGAPGLDNLQRLSLLDRSGLERVLGWRFGAPTFLVTYHPATLAGEDPAIATNRILAALDDFPEAKIILTKPNADAGGRVIIRLLEEYAAVQPERVLLATSLGQVNYLSALQAVDVVIGNSSSGIIEAPFVRTPAVNIGSRQNGRLRASSIIDCEDERESIRNAILQAIDPLFRKTLTQTVSLYGAGDASKTMKEKLKVLPLTSVVKTFYDCHTIHAYDTAEVRDTR